MTKWLLSLLGGVILLALGACLLVLVTIKTSTGAGWMLERALRATVDPDIEVRGSVDVDLLPMMTVRASGLVAPANLGRVPQACLADTGVKEDPVHIGAQRVEWVLDWQSLFTGKILFPVVQLDDLRIMQGLPRGDQATGDQEGLLKSLQGWLASRDTGWMSQHAGLQVDELTINGLTWQQCDASRGLEMLVQARKAAGAFNLKARSDADDEASLGLTYATGQIRFESDDLSVGESFLNAGLLRWLRDSNYLDGDVLQVETVRGQWELESGVATLTSFLLVGAGPNVELVSGEVDLNNQTVSFLFDVDTQRSGQGLTVPGVNIILRRSKLPVSVTGDWHHPAVVVGQE